jgi:hypothetical protein
LRAALALALTLAGLAGPAAAAHAPPTIFPPSPPQTARWLIVEGTPALVGGVGLEWRVTEPGKPERSVGMIGCLRPSGLYFGAGGFKPAAGKTDLTLMLGPARFALPLIPKQDQPALEAVGDTPSGFFEALGGAQTLQFVYGDQSSTTVAAPDPQVTSAFVSVCHRIEAEPHGQGG